MKLAPQLQPQVAELERAQVGALRGQPTPMEIGLPQTLPRATPDKQLSSPY